MHSVSLTYLERFTRSARSIGEEVQAEIQGELSELRLRRIGLVIFWFYLILTIWIIHRYRQRALGKEA